MSKLHIDIDGDNSGFRHSVDDTLSKLDELERGSKKSSSVISESLTSLKGELTGLASGAALAGFVAKLAQVRGEFQKLEVSFGTMLGSADAADAMMSRLAETAARTPFDLGDVASGAKQLLAYGVQADEVVETLTRLGDVAAGLSLPLGDLVYLYGTTMAQGRMFTQDLRQFMGRGIPMMEELARQLGTTSAGVQGLVTAGKVGAEQVKAAIWSMTDAGSRFGGLMEAQSATVTGRMDTVKDEWQQAMNEMGKAAEPVINALLDGASAAVGDWERLGRVALECAGAFGAYKAALVVFVAVRKASAAWSVAARAASIANAAALATDTAATATNTAAKVLAAKAGRTLAAVTARLNAAMAANPYVAVAAAIAALAFGAYKLATRQTEAQKQQGRLSEAMEEGAKSAAKERIALAELRARMEAAGEGTDEYAEARRALIDQYSEYGVTLDEETLSVGNLTSTYDALAEAIERSHAAKAKADFLSGERSSYEELLTGNLANIKAGLLKDAKAGRTTYEAAFAAYEEVAGKMLSGHFLDDGGKWHNDFSAETRKLLNVGGKYSRWLNQIIEARRNLTAVEGQLAEQDLIGPVLPTAKPSASASAAPPAADGTSMTASEAEAASKLAAAKAERTKAIDDYKEGVIAAGRQAELEIRQADIDAMEEGYAKTAAQIQLNYDRLVEANEERRRGMLEALADAKVDEWLNEHPDATKERQLTYRKSLMEGEDALTVDDLAEGQRRQLEEYGRVAAQARAKAEEEALESILQEFQTYEQRRLEIAGEYAAKRSALYERDGDGDAADGEDGTPKLRDGVTQGNLDELDRSEEEALSAVDEEFAQREATYRAWCEGIADMTLDELKSALSEAEALLSEAESSGTATAEVRARAAALRDAVEEAEAGLEAASGDGGWKETHELLGDIADDFKGLGEAAGGALGEAVSGAGQLLTQLAQAGSAVQSLKANWKGLSALGKAQGVLGAASAAASAFQTVAGWLSKIGDARDWLGEYEDAVEDAAEATARAKVEAKLDGDSGVFGTDGWRNLKSSAEAATEALSQYSAKMEEVRRRFRYGWSGVSTWSSNAAAGYADFSSLEESVKAMEVMVRHSTWFRSAKYETLADAAPGLFGEDGQLDWDALEAFVGTDLYGKLSEKNQEYIQELVDGRDEYEEAMESLRDGLEEMFGDLGDSLMDAMTSAFEAGEDAAEGFRESVAEVLESVAESMIYSMTLSPVLDAAQEDAEAIAQDSSLTDAERTERYFDVLAGVADGAIAAQDDATALYRRFKDYAAAQGYDIFTGDSDSDGASATGGGVETITSSQATELNGRFTDVQAKVGVVRDELAAVRASLQSGLSSLLAGSAEMEAQGRLQSGYLLAIRDNTSHLSGMADDLRRMRAKLESSL